MYQGDFDYFTRELLTEFSEGFAVKEGREEGRKEGISTPVPATLG